MITQKLKKAAFTFGADLVGIADTARLEGIETEPKDLLAAFPRAVSMAVRVSGAVMDAITDHPTPLYQQHYLRVNALLDDIALRVMQQLQTVRARALPIPASHVLDKERWSSYISHKAVALAAGLGWQGKSLLVVNPKFGPRIRLVTVLTDAELDPDAPLRNRCGKCAACSEACPAQAIKNVNTTDHFSSRDEALHFEKCVDKVYREFTKLPFIDSPICGVCVRACPFGKKTLRTKD